MHVELRRIEQDIGDVANWVQTLTLSPDRLDDHLAATKRMWPPRLREAPHQHILVRLQKDHPCRQYSPDLLQNRRKLVEPYALAHIDHQRGPLVLRRLPDKVRKARHKIERQVVNGVVPQIFKRLQ